MTRSVERELSVAFLASGPRGSGLVWDWLVSRRYLRYSRHSGNPVRTRRGVEIYSSMNILTECDWRGASWIVRCRPDAAGAVGVATPPPAKQSGPRLVTVPKAQQPIINRACEPGTVTAVHNFLLAWVNSVPVWFRLVEESVEYWGGIPMRPDGVFFFSFELMK